MISDNPDSSNFTFASFNSKYSPEKRLEDSQKIREKYPNRVPILVESRDKHLNQLIRHKYIVPNDINMGQFLFIIKSKIKLAKDEALFMSVSTKMCLIPQTQVIGNVFKEYNEFGYLYVTIDKESVFG